MFEHRRYGGPKQKSQRPTLTYARKPSAATVRLYCFPPLMCAGSVFLVSLQLYIPSLTKVHTKRTAWRYSTLKFAAIDAALHTMLGAAQSENILLHLAFEFDAGCDHIAALPGSYCTTGAAFPTYSVERLPGSAFDDKI